MIYDVGLVLWNSIEDNPLIISSSSNEVIPSDNDPNNENWNKIKTTLDTWIFKRVS